MNRIRTFFTSEHGKKVLAALSLLAIWQAGALLVGNSLLLASPLDVIGRLFTIWKEEGFLESLGTSFLRIAGGFFLGFFLGILLAVFAGRVHTVEIFLAPLMLTIKSVPVASFIIISLIWLSSSKLATFISFLMVLPVIYNNVLTGIKSTDRKLTEMADVFRLDGKKRVKYIWIPQIRPYLMSGASIALGLAWKSGIAAEVIGIPKNSIGENLYLAKAYFNTVDLFTWTLIIVLVSLFFEKTVLRILKHAFDKNEE